MFRTISSKNSNFFIKCLKNNQNGLRTFLSDAYSCNEAWQKRFDCPILKNVKLNTYFIEVDKKFQSKRLASGVDIDIFANAVKQEQELEELEHLLYRFRRTKRSIEMLDSTQYALVRAFLQSRDYESLFRILRNRQNYGVFPDFYSYNMLMDNFLKEQRYKDASEIAILMMQQEAFSNPISRYLGLYSCNMFLKEDPSFEMWNLGEETEKTEEVDNDDGEDVYIRVPFLRNPWFDDHFDIKEPKHLIGKTFHLIGREEKNVLGHSFQLVGLGLYKKWAKAMELINTASESKNSPKFLEEGVVRFKEQLQSLSDDVEEKKNWISEFDNKFANMEKAGKICSGDLDSELESSMKSIPELEKTDIREQEQLFQKWKEDRAKLLKQEEWEIGRELKRKEIKELEEELYWKEKYLYFFENEEAIMDELAEVEKIIESQQLKKSEDAYVPPEIIRKKPVKLSLLRKKAMIKSLQ